MITFPQLGNAGRLGNQLWQIASTIGIARARGEDVMFPDWVYRPYFSIPDDLFGEAPVAAIDASTLPPNLDPRCAVYLQDYNLWKDVKDEVREYFMPSELAIERLKLDIPFNEYIAVHVRRGDNAFDPGTPDKHLYHPLRSADYYRRAIDVLPIDMPIMVFSDDPQWCEQHMANILGRECNVFIGGQPRPKEHEPEYATAPVTDWVDFFAMAMCSQHIISNSTFAWWAAFVSGDPYPIYPSNWFGRLLRDHIDASLMFPSNWIQVFDPTEAP